MMHIYLHFIEKVLLEFEFIKILPPLQENYTPWSQKEYDPLQNPPPKKSTVWCKPKRIKSRISHRASIHLIFPPSHNKARIRLTLSTHINDKAQRTHDLVIPAKKGSHCHDDYLHIMQTAITFSFFQFFCFRFLGNIYKHTKNPDH